MEQNQNIITITVKKERIIAVKKMTAFGVSTFSWKKLPYAFLFTLDVALFTFWYVYLPQQLIEQGFIGMEISILLSLQAFSHAISQSLWERIIIKFGALKSYLISFLLHICIVFFIGNLNFDFIVGCLLFIIMGIFNSGTFLASSMLYYTKKKIIR